MTTSRIDRDYMDASANPILAGYALLLLAGLPAMAALEARRELDPVYLARFRRPVYVSISLSLLLIAGATFGIASWQDIRSAELGWVVRNPTLALTWAAGTTAAGLAVTWVLTLGARAIGLRESTLATLLMPRTAGETRAFLLLSGIAGVCEEYVFRGFLQHTLEAWVSSPWFAAAIISVSFGLAHGYQKLAGIVRATALGFVMAVPVVQTGSLFPAIVAHFWVNAALGLGAWRYLVSDDENQEIERILEEAREPPDME